MVLRVQSWDNVVENVFNGFVTQTLAANALEEEAQHLS